MCRHYWETNRRQHPTSETINPQRYFRLFLKPRYLTTHIQSSYVDQDMHACAAHVLRRLEKKMEAREIWKTIKLDSILFFFTHKQTDRPAERQAEKKDGVTERENERSQIVIIKQPQSSQWCRRSIQCAQHGCAMEPAPHSLSLLPTFSLRHTSTRTRMRPACTLFFPVNIFP